MFDLLIDGKKQTKRISSVILKMDENNQYGQAMIKPLPYGCMKRKENPPALYEFNNVLDIISHDDKIDHLFIVDMKFQKLPKTLLFNEIYPTVLEKKKIDPYERSCLQLMSIIQRNEEKDQTNSFFYTFKTHSTMEEKKFIPLYAEHLHFLVKELDG